MSIWLRDWSRSGGSYGNNTRVICCPAPGRPESAARGTSPLVTIIATLGVLWASRRVASPSIEIPIHFWKKKFADKLHKSYKKHSWQTSPTFSGHFTLQAEPKINWNNYISMVLWACFSNKVCIYQKTNNQNGGCYDHMTHEITLAGSHSLHWGRVQWKIPCLRAKRFS